ncbi:unnamed protein product [Rotaria sordida]|uniref:Uncharacterized protein n=1 Tax=Rotaria sordida TaxID=392033 RepID=A0A815BSI4_9BILA|nr:unnamed protein product [Rotaria sordida]
MKYFIFFVPGPNCTDGVMNQNETDIDCGGGMCPKCNNGKSCRLDGDCVSNQCVSNICQQCNVSSFINGDFELGNSSGWKIGGGSRKKIDSPLLNASDFYQNGSLYVSSIATTHSGIVTSGDDPNLKTLMPKIVYRVLFLTFALF